MRKSAMGAGEYNQQFLHHRSKTGAGHCPVITYYAEKCNGSGIKKRRLHFMEKNADYILLFPLHFSV